MPFTCSLFHPEKEEEKKKKGEKREEVEGSLGGVGVYGKERGEPRLSPSERRFRGELFLLLPTSGRERRGRYREDMAVTDRYHFCLTSIYREEGNKKRRLVRGRRCLFLQPFSFSLEKKKGKRNWKA